jgi:hypothetical protein
MSGMMSDMLGSLSVMLEKSGISGSSIFSEMLGISGSSGSSGIDSEQENRSVDDIAIKVNLFISYFLIKMV